MTFIDFFAGIGGFRVGMESAGHKCIGFCEYDKYAIASYTSMYLITDEQREYLNTLKLRNRQKEILKEKYRNGEWFADDIRKVSGGGIPRADCWCFGAPCQDFSISGKRKGLSGDRSSLVKEVFRLINEIKEEDNRPEWIIYENVKGMLSSNNGWDYFTILSEMESLGYDPEWELLNSKDYGVPQNRERVYTIGHLRSRGSKRIFPIRGTTEKNSISIKQIGKKNNASRRNPNASRVYDPDYLSPTLNTSGGGQREPMIIVGKVNPERHSDTDIYHPSSIIGILTTRSYKESKNIGILRNVRTEYGKKIRKEYESGNLDISRHDFLAKEIRDDGISNTLSTVIKDNYLAVETENNKDIPLKYYPKGNCYVAVRKLTPKEYFRLQGFNDEYYERAAFVNSKSRLYKQAGNGVTTTVVQAIGEKLNEQDL